MTSATGSAPLAGRRPAQALLIACGLLALVGCNKLTERRLRGAWESERLPRRSLVLAADGSYTRRLSGRALGVISDVLGPEQGAWRVEAGALLLVDRGDGGAERTVRLPIDRLSSRAVTLAGERWRRLVDTPQAPR